MSEEKLERSFGDEPTDPNAGGVRKTPPKRFRSGDEILGRYVVQAELGQGAMGVVYKCLDKTGGVEVAVKGLPPEVSHNSDEMEEIRDNFQLVCELRHPNVAGIRTLEKDANGDYYLVMDVAHGENLSRWLRRHRGDEHRAAKLAILGEIASALDYAHSRKVMHRDVKPENVMIDDAGHAQVLDFGLAARIRTSMSRVSQMVTAMSGTPGYKSPEQWRGQAQGAASDQYALGVVAYKTLSGELPFDSDDMHILREAVLTETVPALPDEPEHVNRALARALAKSAADRFATCADFIAALRGEKPAERSAADMPGNGTTARKPAAAPSKPDDGKGKGASRWKGVAAVFALGALGAAGYFGVAQYGAAQERRAEARRQAMLAAKNAAIDFKTRAKGALDDAATRGFGEFPELAQLSRDLANGYQSGLEAFDNGDYAGATNFFSRVGTAMHALVEGKKRCEAERARRKRAAEIDGKVKRGYVRRKGADGEDEAAWVAGSPHPTCADLKAAADAETWTTDKPGYKWNGADGVAWTPGVAHSVKAHWRAGAEPDVWQPEPGYRLIEGSAANADGTLAWTPGDEVDGRRAGTAEGEWLVRRQCATCRGEGTESFAERCATCSGTGRRTVRETCAKCGGRGSLSASSTCTTCSGAGRRLGPCTGGCGAVSRNGRYLFHGFVCSRCGGNATIPNTAGAVGNLIGGLLGGGKYRPPPPPQMVPCPDCELGGIRCSTCNGSGQAFATCATCRGSGSVGSSRTCGECNGAGKTTHSAACGDCTGGRVKKSRVCTDCKGSGAKWEPAP